MNISRTFSRFANAVARMTGRPVSFIICCTIIAVWAITGPIFKYSDTWQLVINTGTTIVTFLMVFLIQNQQNRDGAAIQAKLDELLRAVENARNDYIGIEHLTDTELEEILQETEREACGDNRDDPEGQRKLAILRESFGRLRRHAPK